jgi:iron-sulfur cluster repair protein YtfE (RIC family)
VLDNLSLVNDQTDAPYSLHTDCELPWRDRPVSAVAAHVSSTYHELNRDRLAVIGRLLPRIAQSTAREHPLVAALTATVTRLRDAIETHDWTEDDLLFPVLVAHEHPDVLSTRVSTSELDRLVGRLEEQHVEIRQIIVALDELDAALDIQPGTLTEVEALLKHVRRLTTSLLEEMDLEDRCLLARARELAGSTY